MPKLPPTARMTRKAVNSFTEPGTREFLGSDSSDLDFVARAIKWRCCSPRGDYRRWDGVSRNGRHRYIALTMPQLVGCVLVRCSALTSDGPPRSRNSTSLQC